MSEYLRVATEDRPLKSLTDFLYPMPARRSVGGIVAQGEIRPRCPCGWSNRTRENAPD